MPRVIEVIESEITRGEGKDMSDPVRVIMQYHTKNGEFLAERDTSLVGVRLQMVEQRIVRGPGDTGR